MSKNEEDLYILSTETEYDKDETECKYNNKNDPDSENDSDDPNEQSYRVNLSYKNVVYALNVDYETYTNIENDEAYREAYAKQTYENLIKSDQGTLLEEPGFASEDQKNFKWTKTASDHLIKFRLNREKEFNNPKTKKSELWQDIALEMRNLNYDVTSEMCDTKYRNLLHTYKINKIKEKRLGCNSIRWDHFDRFESVLGKKAETMFKGALSAGESSSKVKNSPFHAMVERKRKYQMAEWLLRMKTENDEKKLKLKEKIWAEKKELKEKEINAILELTKAVHSNNRQIANVFKAISKKNC